MKINVKDTVIILLLLALGFITYLNFGKKQQPEVEYVVDTTAADAAQAENDALKADIVRLKSREVQAYEDKPCRCNTSALKEKIAELELANEALHSQLKSHIPEVIIQPVEKFVKEDNIPIATLDTSIPDPVEDNIPIATFPSEPQPPLPDIRAKWFEVGAGPFIDKGVGDLQISIGAGKGNWGGRINYQPLNRVIIPEVVYKRIF